MEGVGTSRDWKRVGPVPKEKPETGISAVSSVSSGRHLPGPEGHYAVAGEVETTASGSSLTYSTRMMVKAYLAKMSSPL